MNNNIRRRTQKNKNDDVAIQLADYPSSASDSSLNNSLNSKSKYYNSQLNIKEHKINNNIINEDKTNELEYDDEFMSNNSNIKTNNNDKINVNINNNTNNTNNNNEDLKKNSCDDTTNELSALLGANNILTPIKTDSHVINFTTEDVSDI